MSKGIVVKLILLGGIALTPGASRVLAGYWTHSKVASKEAKNFQAGQITGKVGYLDDHLAQRGKSQGTFGTYIGGEIEDQLAGDNKTQDNFLEQKFVWTPEDEGEKHPAMTLTGEVVQDPSGSGLSVVLPGGELASTYVSKVHDITWEPSGGNPIQSDRLSLEEELNDTDTFIVEEGVGHWKMDLTLSENDQTVRLTAISRAQAVLNGKLCSVGKQIQAGQVSGKADVRLKMTLTLEDPAAQ